jgi:hypothetical protein
MSLSDLSRIVASSHLFCTQVKAAPYYKNFMDQLDLSPRDPKVLPDETLIDYAENIANWIRGYDRDLGPWSAERDVILDCLNDIALELSKSGHSWRRKKRRAILDTLKKIEDSSLNTTSPHEAFNEYILKSTAYFNLDRLLAKPREYTDANTKITDYAGQLSKLANEYLDKDERWAMDCEQLKNLLDEIAIKAQKGGIGWQKRKFRELNKLLRGLHGRDARGKNRFSSFLREHYKMIVTVITVFVALWQGFNFWIERRDLATANQERNNVLSEIMRDDSYIQGALMSVLAKYPNLLQDKIEKCLYDPKIVKSLGERIAAELLLPLPSELEKIRGHYEALNLRVSANEEEIFGRATRKDSSLCLTPVIFTWISDGRKKLPGTEETFDPAKAVIVLEMEANGYGELSSALKGTNVYISKYKGKRLQGCIAQLKAFTPPRKEGPQHLTGTASSPVFKSLGYLNPMKTGRVEAYMLFYCPMGLKEQVKKWSGGKVKFLGIP